MIHAPTGKVTLVFTDIQGSTILWDQLGRKFQPLLDQHNSIFRDAIEEFGGYEVKTEGDSFMVAFSSAKKAVSMCLRLQERLHNSDWPDLLDEAPFFELAGKTKDGAFCGLRVRMGVHTGRPECRTDPVTGRMDYFGRMVNRAARTAQVGHGGQLIVSQSTWEAVVTGLPEGTLVGDLGEHAFRGLERREHLRQLLPARMSERRFPPLNTPTLKRTNLPTRLDSFFGREAEIGELSARFRDGQRLVTLLGPGGTGKTRLSQRFGAKQLAEFPGGVWFCDLTEAHTRLGIFSAMSSAMELPLISKDPEAQLADAILGRGRVLIILDNFEQVVEHAAETLGRWLQRAPESTFLVTSRTILHIAGEEVMYLNPLPLTEAVDLFFDRARAVQPKISRTEESEALVVKIVERLDGMSLAIELAAARIRMLSLENILSRLSERFKLLRGQRRDQSTRQSSLRGVIDWSWFMLKPYEMSALSQLSVFHGGCTLEAAEEVVNLDAFKEAPWVMDVLTGLVDQSLLRRIEPYPGHVRYRMLESIREYSFEKLGKDVSDTTLRHARYFTKYGEEGHILSLDAHGAVERHKSQTLEVENLLAGVDKGLSASEPEIAVSCALAAFEVFLWSGPICEGVSLMHKVISLPVPPVLQTRLFSYAGSMLNASGFPKDAMSYYKKAYVLASEMENRRLEGFVYLKLADVHWSIGKVEDALEHYTQALVMLREAKDRRFEGIALGDLANLYHGLGRLGDALEKYTQALVILRETGDRRYEGVTLGNLAHLYQSQGRFSEAQMHYDEALAIHREVGNRKAEGTTLTSIAALYQSQGRTQEALDFYSQSLVLAREVGDRRLEGIDLGNLGDLQYAEGNNMAAEPNLRLAIAICDETVPAGAGAFRGTLALISAQQGSLVEARQLIEKGESQLRGVYKGELGKLLCKKAIVEHIAGDAESTHLALAEAESIAVELNVGPDSELSKSIVKARDVSLN